jgi:hypothetical protein
MSVVGLKAEVREKRSIYTCDFYSVVIGKIAADCCKSALSFATVAVRQQIGLVLFTVTPPKECRKVQAWQQSTAFLWMTMLKNRKCKWTVYMKKGNYKKWQQ